MSMIETADAATRKSYPITTGVLDYFPDALLEVAKVSKAGNDQHNPGQPLHWSKEKSKDHADTLVRHMLDRGKFDSDGMRHSAKIAWRALALLQTELEAEQAAWSGKPADLVIGPQVVQHERRSGMVSRRMSNKPKSSAQRHSLNARGELNPPQGRRKTDLVSWWDLPHK